VRRAHRERTSELVQRPRVSHSLTQELGTIDHKAMSTRYVHDVTMLRRTERGDDGGQQRQQMSNALGSWAVAATSIESLEGIQVHLARPELLIVQMDFFDDARLARRQGSAPQQGAKRRPLREPGELVLQHCGNEAAVRDGKLFAGGVEMPGARPDHDRPAGDHAMRTVDRAVQRLTTSDESNLDEVVIVGREVIAEAEHMTSAIRSRRCTGTQGSGWLRHGGEVALDLTIHRALEAHEQLLVLGGASRPPARGRRRGSASMRALKSAERLTAISRSHGGGFSVSFSKMGSRTTSGRDRR
jgi:hypothetical protein